MGYGDNKTTVTCPNCTIPVVYERIALDVKPGEEQKYVHKMSRAGVRVEANSLEEAIAKLCNEVEKIRVRNRRKS